jgi:DNA-directed RNA polymerase subunit K/omega
MDSIDKKLPLEKLLDIKESQYKIAKAAFKRVYQIAGNDKLKSLLPDSKRLPIVALSSILNEEVKILDEVREGESLSSSDDDTEEQKELF